MIKSLMRRRAPIAVAALAMLTETPAHADEAIWSALRKERKSRADAPCGRGS